ncbi:MAG: NYN domain-containing protein [Paracoccaceae bacterium]
MPEASVNLPGIAVFVDAENFSHRNAPRLMTHILRYGVPSRLSAYGEERHSVPWQAHGFFSVITGKGENLADLALSVDAVTVALHSDKDLIAIVTSDGDLAYVANRLVGLRRSVIGFGEAKAPKNLRSACTEFVEIGALI